MGTSVKSFLTVIAMLFVAACVVPKDFDTGGDIRAVHATLAMPKTVYFATTRCHENPSAGAPGTKEELFSKRCWDEDLKNEDSNGHMERAQTELRAIPCTDAAMPPPRSKG